MFVIDDAALVRYAARQYLEGRQTSSLADWAAASKVVDLAAARQRLRPAERDTISNALNPGAGI
jgi:hypothetical protein